jgi:oxepin-CoA hydrolase/3-oxo-5,6-dehydrosuberyl-CoA semialdehyde dehydrogenase
MQLQNYVTGKWMNGRGEGQPLFDASTGELVATATSDGLNFEEMLNYGRKVGNKNLRKTDFSGAWSYAKSTGSISDG